MKDYNNKLFKSFRHSVPYINAHRGKIFVIIISGEVINHKNFFNIINDIGLLHILGIKLVIVYGATPQINTSLKKIKLKSLYYKNNRITDLQTLDIIKQVAGKLQLEITARLSMTLNNTPLAGSNINVVSGNFIISQPLGIKNGVDYGHSGKIRRIDDKAINIQMNNGNIVLLGPIGVSVTGESFNLSSEEIATKIAIKLQAEKIIGFCKKQGIINDNGNTIPELLSNEVQQYIEKLENKNIMHNFSIISFLKGSIIACRNNVKRSHLISYQKDGALLQELFSCNGIGTQIVMEPTEKIYNANINDIGGILKLIRPLEREGILVRRSREQLEIEINKFIIIKRDNNIIACAALYSFKDEKIGEIACLAVHPDYRCSSRGRTLLHHIILHAKKIGLIKLFVLTTSSIHWFQEFGFIPADINSLPEDKKKMYNYNRKSRVLIIDLYQCKKNIL